LRQDTSRWGGLYVCSDGGVKPRQKSSAERICFCPQCAVSLAMGLPPEGALNMAAWESLRGVVALLGSGEDSGAASDARVRFRRAG
jgi:hypothetical protein